MKLQKSFLAIGVVGMLLVGAVGMTQTKGVSKVNKEAYATYLQECDYLNTLGFKGYAPKETKVRFFDGDYDFVVSAGEEWKKESPVLNVLAGTTWQVGEEYQAVVPVYEKLQGLTEMVGNIQKLQEVVKEEDREVAATGEDRDARAAETENASAEEKDQANNSLYSETMYVTTICHEVFHCWQFTNFEDQIVNGTHNYSGDRETIITEEIDSVEELAASVEREVNLYRDAYFTENLNTKKELVAAALQESAKRGEKLSDNAKNVEYFIETLEGSAQYVEAMSFRHLTSEEEFESQYLDEFVYSGGSGKYYRIGLYQCLLLDQLSGDWQAEFSFENSPSTILQNMVQ